MISLILNVFCSEWIDLKQWLLLACLSSNHDTSQCLFVPHYLLGSKMAPSALYVSGAIAPLARVCTKHHGPTTACNSLLYIVYFCVAKLLQLRQYLGPNLIKLLPCDFFNFVQKFDKTAGLTPCDFFHFRHKYDKTALFFFFF